MQIRPVIVLFVATLGCRAEKPLTPENEPAVTLSVSVPPSVKLGEWMTIDADLTNLGERTIVMENGGKEVMTDFLWAATDSQVYSLPGPVWTAELDIKTVAPGATFRVTRQWNLRNGSGKPVPPGTYRIRARALIPREFPVRIDATPVTFVVTQ